MQHVNDFCALSVNALQGSECGLSMSDCSSHDAVQTLYHISAAQ